MVSFQELLSYIHETVGLIDRIHDELQDPTHREAVEALAIDCSLCDHYYEGQDLLLSAGYTPWEPPVGTNL
jgi:hypothetical protein